MSKLSTQAFLAIFSAQFGPTGAIYKASARAAAPTAGARADARSRRHRQQHATTRRQRAAAQPRHGTARAQRASRQHHASTMPAPCQPLAPQPRSPSLASPAELPASSAAPCPRLPVAASVRRASLHGEAATAGLPLARPVVSRIPCRSTGRAAYRPRCGPAAQFAPRRRLGLRFAGSVRFTGPLRFTGSLRFRFKFGPTAGVRLPLQPGRLGTGRSPSSVRKEIPLSGRRRVAPLLRPG